MEYKDGMFFSRWPLRKKNEILFKDIFFREIDVFDGRVRKSFLLFLSISVSSIEKKYLI